MISKFSFCNSLVLLILMVSACTCNPNRSIPNIEKNTFDIKTYRFDLLLTGSDSVFTIGMRDSLLSQFPAFFPLYTQYIIRVGPPEADQTITLINDFISDPEIAELNAGVREQFTSMAEIEIELSKSFGFYRHYFPNSVMPKVVTFISGLNYSVISADSILGIGLDMYLGSGNKLYSMAGFPLYKQRTMQKPYVVSDCMKGWLQSDYDPSMVKGELLSQMIYKGKIWYALKDIMPSTNDSLITHYSPQHEAWCKANEFNIWSTLINKNLLYSTDEFEYGKYVNDGPTTSGLPAEAPPMIGAWIGLQIVNKYMEANPQVSLQQLMEETDSQKLLSRSGYKPKK